MPTNETSAKNLSDSERLDRLEKLAHSKYPRDFPAKWVGGHGE